MIKLEVSTVIKPSEDPEKVKSALRKIYDFKEFKEEGPDDEGTINISAEAYGIDALRYFFEQVRKQRIVQAIRNQMLSIMDINNNEVEFMINKQALTRGIFSFCSGSEESPLGPVYIRISAKDIEYVLNYLFPETEDGKVLEVDYLPRE